ncbi:MAG: glycosyltransferase family 2 protein [Pseudomonadota bacterium]
MSEPLTGQDERAESPFSAVIITLNAEARIEACLKSVAFANEILVVDSGSTDATMELARRHGARVIQQGWLGYGQQKQFAASRAGHDWVLALDADERVSPELRESILEALKAPRFMAYRMPRRNRFMGRWLKHGEGYPDLSLRLFHRAHANWSDDPIHEKVVARTNVGALRGDLLHESENGIADYLAKQNRYTTLQAEALYRNGKRARLSRLLLSPLLRFIKFYFLRLGLLDGLPGLVHIAIGCFNSFLKYAKLAELARKAADATPRQ